MEIERGSEIEQAIRMSDIECPQGCERRNLSIRYRVPDPLFDRINSSDMFRINCAGCGTIIVEKKLQDE